ncbi:S-adenosyl-L-methionine-dependent methyltransferase, partial [Thamnocephalis sphaerospora]
SVLDIGTGTGEWALDMAEEWPDCQVLGVDLYDRFPWAKRPPNCQFFRMDICDGLSFNPNTFDLVHWRYLVAGIPSEEWHHCFAELFRVTRPGGWIQVTESDGRHLDCGPVAAAINTLSHRFSSANGIDLELIRHLDVILRAVGFVHVERTVVSLPVGRW